MAPMLPRFLRWLANAVMQALIDIRVEGFDNLPPHGPYILVANHLSFWDAPIIYGLLGGSQLVGWAAEKWERNLVLGPILRAAGSIFIQRGEVDRSALDRAVDWLRRGHAFGMSPEGTRTKTGGLQRGKSGAAYLAHETGAPIVPLAHFGTEKVGKSWLRLRRPHITVRMGKPFALPVHLPGEGRGALRPQADEVMCHIAALLPPDYRGVYADHPRLKELLASERVLV